MMRYLTSLFYRLRSLPYPIRLTIGVLGILVAFIGYAYFWSVIYDSYDPFLFAYPIALAAWTLKKRDFLLFFVILLVGTLVFHSIQLRTIVWPVSFTLYLAYKTFIFFLEGLLVMALGYLMDTHEESLQAAEAGRRQAEQARKQIEQVYERQRQLNYLKHLFILNVNHELRTPLTSLGGFLAVLKRAFEKKGSLDRATHEPMLTQAMQKSDAMRLIVNDVLDTLDIGSIDDPPTFEAFSLAEMVRTVIDHYAIVEQHTYCIHIDIPEDIRVWANVHYTTHVIRNLLSNAFKYSPPNSTVVISAPTQCNDEHALPLVTICVKDQGLGIPKEEMPLLFKEFIRLERDIGGPVQGIGVGLFISKNYVEAMGGRIWVESHGISGDGSSFCFTLPCAPS